MMIAAKPADALVVAATAAVRKCIKTAPSSSSSSSRKRQKDTVAVAKTSDS